jgi:MFS family permease
MIITQMWYTRKQQPLRIGLWYTANGLGIAGGGLLGYAIGHIKGSLPSWKYEFLLVGALCCCWGIVMVRIFFFGNYTAAVPIMTMLIVHLSAGLPGNGALA